MNTQQKEQAIMCFKKKLLQQTNIQTLLAIEIETFARQIVDSINKTTYFKMIAQRQVSVVRTQPHHVLFDPIRSVLYYKNKDIDEACWLIFLMVHTGDSTKKNWQFVRELYDVIGQWDEINFDTVENWLKQAPKFKFGGHRKYESLSQLMDVVFSYQTWIKKMGGHVALFNQPFDTPKQRYAWIYQKMRIFRFGRLAKYDYLGLCALTGIASLKADRCYIQGSSGPLKGAKRLFGAYDEDTLNEMTMRLAENLEIGYQEIEDALCNWQKSPQRYKNNK